ncbi:MAG: phosphatidate cytidylyltransferase [Alphaproteobacteria bacterium]|nr:phosphatidate cytidylyltransferase [Alphaproteobacteria bacterium]
MSKWADLKVRTISAAVLIAGFIAIVEAGITAFSIAMVAVWLILIWEWWGFSHYRTSTFKRLLSLFLGTIYITLGVLGFWFLYRMGFDYKSEPEEINSVYFLVIQVAVIDIGGYVFGKLFGKHKLAPQISPGKTWEGLAGSILCSIISAYVLVIVYYGESDLNFSLVAGVALAIVALLGDLLESRMKRKAGLKDSSKIIPGHGGLFDRVDGLLPCAILATSPNLFLYIILVLVLGAGL